MMILSALAAFVLEHRMRGIGIVQIQYFLFVCCDVSSLGWPFIWPLRPDRSTCGRPFIGLRRLRFAPLFIVVVWVIWKRGFGNGTEATNGDIFNINGAICIQKYLGYFLNLDMLSTLVAAREYGAIYLADGGLNHGPTIFILHDMIELWKRGCSCIRRNLTNSLPSN